MLRKEKKNKKEEEDDDCGKADLRRQKQLEGVDKKHARPLKGKLTKKSVFQRSFVSFLFSHYMALRMINNFCRLCFKFLNKGKSFLPYC